MVPATAVTAAKTEAMRSAATALALTTLRQCSRSAVGTVKAPAPKRILILKADRLYAEMLRSRVVAFIVAGEIALASSLADATRQVAIAGADLLISGIGAPDGDIPDVLPNWLGPERSVRRVFFITGRKEPRVLNALMTLGVAGAFDQSAEGAAELDVALRCVLAGESYWSPSIVETIATHCLAPDAILRRLTQAERTVLAVIGDGSDDVVAAERLHLKPATISSVRRSLHRKLGIQHRGELLRMAVQLGFVRISPGGIVRAGATTPAGRSAGAVTGAAPQV
jgi:DNA-binding NarL/FixJ family response regulator